MPSIRIFANSITGHFSKRSERIYTTDSYNTKKWTEVDWINLFLATMVLSCMGKSMIGLMEHTNYISRKSFVKEHKNSLDDGTKLI